MYCPYGAKNDLFIVFYQYLAPMEPLATKLSVQSRRDQISVANKMKTNAAP
jgi:hypothetical protein